MRTPLLAYATAVLGCVTAFAQPAAESQPPRPEPAIAIPLEPYLGALALIHAVVNGQSGIFLFDTGQGVSVFSPAFAARVGCHPWGRISGFRMTGERLDSPHCDGVTFELAGQKLTVPVVGILDVMKFLGADAPPVDGALGLDLFADRQISVVARRQIVLESPASLLQRIKNARELPIRMVRDVEGIALCVDAAVRTRDGLAWMELDNGNGGPLVVANHIAPLLGLATDVPTPQPGRFELANGIVVDGAVRTRDLIMDGNISAQFLNQWTLTLDLEHGRAWLGPLPAADH